jgi:hypothetical protein
MLMAIVGLGVLCQPSPAADVAAIGDSMMKAVGRAIRKQYKTANADVEVLTSIGSGLARLDQFDWHAQAKALMAAESPAMVFVMMGTNDNQPMRTGAGVLAFGTPGWNVEYGRRVGQLMDLLLDGGKRKVVWVGLPRMREDKLDADVRSMEAIVMKQVDAREDVTFFSTFELLSPADGYKAYIKQDNGMPLDVRSPDGIHLNRNGAEFLAKQLFDKFPASALK